MTISPAKTASKLTYDVLIENEQDGRFNATVLGFPDCKSLGATKEEALKELIQHLQARLEKAEIVTLEIEPPKVEHSWMEFGGMFKDDPQFDEMLAYIEADRRQLDAQMEEYYRQLDTENETK
ncbi:type II toxin-antitoxin system HicB family antitoxin [Nostoc sp.]|uniref:type II toxin-antitoxin system HicB family antitoxin n=1 Tax=Nostoc sp. TaxID=1180 RepID=UPI002FF890DD